MTLSMLSPSAKIWLSRSRKGYNSAVLTHFGLARFAPTWAGSVVCLGTFDGVHTGHQKVIRTATEEARRREQPCLVVTFDRHPFAVVRPEALPPYVSTLSQNLGVMEGLGVDHVLVLPFTYELSQTPAETFLQHILRDALRANFMVMGHDMAFGKGREGTGTWLQDRLAATIVEPFEIRGQRVSSSAIRQAIKEGEVAQAKEWLGRPFALDGTVVSGERMGRTLGFPTANLSLTENQVLPKVGIYAGFAMTEHGPYQAAISVGRRPTFGEFGVTIEAFLLDYPGNSLYGTSLRLSFEDWVRDEHKFDSIDELKRQMALDVERVRRFTQ